MAQARVKTQVERRAELVERVLDILSPQLDREPVVTVSQHIELQAAIAEFAEGRNDLRVPPNAPGAGPEN